MNHILTISALGILLILAVCLERETQFVIKQIYSVDSVRVIQHDEKKAVLSVSATVPTPCYTFAHFEQKRRGDTVEVTIYAKTDPEINCIQVLGKITCEISVDLKKAGISQILFRGLSDDYALYLKAENNKEKDE